MTVLYRPRPKKRRRPNHRLVKIHRTYTVEEIATLFDIHRNTVRSWIKAKLEPIDDKRPLLILGRTLADYLRDKKSKLKSPCGPGRMYCLKCRAPKAPAGAMGEYRPLTPTSGNLIGICPDCETLLFRRVSLAKLSLVAHGIQVTLPEAAAHIAECT